MDPTVSSFYDKNADQGYRELYRLDHSPRLAAVLARYGLKESLAGKRVVDVGGGLGFLGELLDPSTDYWVIDGAETRRDQRVAKGHYLKADLDHDHFGTSSFVERHSEAGPDLLHPNLPEFDAAFCQETLEHCISPYHCVTEIKKLVRRDGPVFLSVPTETVLHNTPYPSLFWPPQNFAQWLGQMALPIIDFWVYEPKERGWPAYQYFCRNADWTEARMLYPKDDPKFYGKTPQEYCNL